jgi:hypothetical protein
MLHVSASLNFLWNYYRLAWNVHPKIARGESKDPIWAAGVGVVSTTKRGATSLDDDHRPDANHFERISVDTIEISCILLR